MNSLISDATHVEVALVIAGMLIIFLFWKEWVRNRKSNLLLRLGASTLMVVALLLLYLQPKVATSKANKDILVITPDVDRVLLDSLRVEFEEIISYDSLDLTEIRGKSIMVAGRGIPIWDFRRWKGMAPTYLKGSWKSNKIQQVKYNNRALVGETFELVGTIEPHDSIQITLNGFNTTLDSVWMTTADTIFRLKTELTVPGRYLMDVEVKTPSGVMIEKNAIPLIVKEPAKVNVLILNSFPTFEMKYLKNYLIAQGQHVTLRNQLSQDRFKYEFYNTSESRFSAITDELLKTVDLLIIDYPSLTDLSNQELAILKKNIVSFGLGVFIQPEDRFFQTNNRLINFSAEKVKRGKSKLLFDNNEKETEPLDFILNDGNAMVEDKAGNKIAVSSRYGLGKVGTSLLSSTYSWTLEGDKESHELYWKTIIDGLLEKNGSEPEFHTSALPFKDEPVDLRFATFNEPPEVKIDSTAISLKQDYQLFFEWKGTFWPGREGWHKVQINDQEDWLYVHNDTTWQGVVARHTSLENERMFIEKMTQDIQPVAYKAFSKWWFYLTFLICAGYLWLEPKLS